MTENLNLEVFKVYEDGKHRRYSLLFSVNGGAFAIAKLLAGGENLDKVVGHLHLRPLSVGMVVFTMLMVYDINKFAVKMRSLQENREPEVYGKPGKWVLRLTGILICAGWLLAAW